VSFLFLSSHQLGSIKKILRSAGLFTLAIVASWWTQAAIAKDPPLQKVTVALDWTPNTNHTGLYVAKAQGDFKKSGLDVTLIQPNQTSATKLVAAGAADFGISFMSDVFKARAKGLPVRAVAAIMQSSTSCFAWRETSPIRTVKDWENKRYGGWGTPEEEATIRYIMKKNNADFSKVKIVTTGVEDFVPATNGHADFMWVYMGWGGMMAKIKGVKIKTLCAKDLDPLFDRPAPLITVSETTLATKGDLVKKFLSAVGSGYQLASSNPKAASALLLKEVPELDPELVLRSAEFLAPYYMKDAKQWGSMKPKIWELVGQWLKENAIVDKIEASQQYFTNDYLPQ
jgi:ABC-type nitrate/sulfonate/bicarbonate transport system substrate-binding protein